MIEGRLTLIEGRLTLIEGPLTLIEGPLTLIELVEITGFNGLNRRKPLGRRSGANP